MELNVFKDKLFDLINESPDLDLVNIAWNEKKNLLVAKFLDGSQFAVQIKRAWELTDEEQEGLVNLGSGIDLQMELAGKVTKKEA